MTFSAARSGARAASQVLRATGRRGYAADAGFKLPENQFNKLRENTKKHAQHSTDLWRKLAIYATIPAIAAASLNAYVLWNEHWEHKSHEPPREEQPEYPYQNIRTKNFFWGNGDKTLFWNDNVNYHKKE